jgi:hypothetical protein
MKKVICMTTFSYSIPYTRVWDNYFLVCYRHGVFLETCQGSVKLDVAPAKSGFVSFREKNILKVGHLVNSYTDGEEALRLFLSQPDEKQNKEIRKMFESIIQKIGIENGINIEAFPIIMAL